MFANPWLERLSKVHFSVPLLIYVPVICWFCIRAFVSGISSLQFLAMFVAGVAVWTATEYMLHRYVFHFVPDSRIGKRIHFIFHGVHHDYPKDAKRLVMPPSASVPLAVGFYFLFYLLFDDKAWLYAFYSGFIFGYLFYDMIHYAIHHYNFKSSLMKKVKQHHMRHHYDDPTRGYGVSSALWDKLLRSNFEWNKKQHG